MIDGFVLDNESKIKGKILFSYIPYNFYRFLKLSTVNRPQATAATAILHSSKDSFLSMKTRLNGLSPVIPRQIIRTRTKA